MDESWLMLAGTLRRRNRNIALILYPLFAMGVNATYENVDVDLASHGLA